MSIATRPAPGMRIQRLSWPLVGGGGFAFGETAQWQMLVVYRGQHCPMCKHYLNTLNDLTSEFSALGIEVAALSADPIERAEADVGKFKWKFPVAYGLSPQEMRQLGLYISEPRSAKETDRAFAEPGLFVLNPQGTLQVVETSNAPFARPDLKTLLQGLKFVTETGYPIRGTVA